MSGHSPVRERLVHDVQLSCLKRISAHDNTRISLMVCIYITGNIPILVLIVFKTADMLSATLDFCNNIWGWYLLTQNLLAKSSKWIRPTIKADGILPDFISDH